PVVGPPVRDLSRGAGSGPRGHDGRAADLSRPAGAAHGSPADAAVPRRCCRRGAGEMSAGAIAAIDRRRSPHGRARTAPRAPGGARDGGRLTRQLPAWYGRGRSRRFQRETIRGATTGACVGPYVV